MINRRALICASRSAKTVTRTAIGHGDRQEHEFACPGCGVTISFVLNIDQEAVDFSYSEPQNAEWCDSDDGAKDVLSFDAERVVPSDLPPFISPYIATYHKLSDSARYAEDEMLRQQWRDLFWPRVKRTLVHFENDNGTLFDKEVGPLELPLDHSTKGGRLTLLNRLQEGGFNQFAMLSRGQRDRVRQRLALAESISESLVDQLTEGYRTSGRIDSLSREIRDVRDALLKQYDSLSPLVQLRYWRSQPQQLSEVMLSTKRFDPLRQLHIDTFETLCRLLVIATGVEWIIKHRALSMPTKKGQMELWGFEEMANGRKIEILKEYPIADLFVPVMDHKLRNGIGHNSAHYVAKTEEVVYHHGGGQKRAQARMPYTCFASRTLALTSVIELAVMYHSALHLRSVSGI